MPDFYFVILDPLYYAVNVSSKGEGVLKSSKSSQRSLWMAPHVLWKEGEDQGSLEVELMITFIAYLRRSYLFSFP